jgi:hypothetical protein
MNDDSGLVSKAHSIHRALAVGPKHAYLDSARLGILWINTALDDRFTACPDHPGAQAADHVA